MSILSFRNGRVHKETIPGKKKMRLPIRLFSLDSSAPFGYKRTSFCPDSSVGRAED